MGQLTSLWTLNGTLMTHERCNTNKNVGQLHATSLEVDEGEQDSGTAKPEVSVVAVIALIQLL